MRRVRRPRAKRKKIHCRNEFELCYLRHRYFRKAKYNPTQKNMQPFMNIASHLAKNTFFTYRNLFHMIGFESEDLISIAQVHLVSFLGLFSLEQMPAKYKEFVHTFDALCGEKPKSNDILEKNQANFTLFLKQRMEDVVRVCRQKVRNIKGFPAEEYHYYFGPKKPPKNLKELLKNYEKLGFRKLDTAIYKSIRKRAGSVTGSAFKIGENYYIAVPLDKRSLSLEDFAGANMNPYDNLHNMSPEEMYFSLEDAEIWKKRKKAFSKKPKDAKAKIFEKFIELNQANPIFEKEVALAKKLLEEMQQ